MILFKHYKNNKVYKVVDLCLIQIDDEWADAVIYTNTEESEELKFVRSASEFFKKFKRVQQQI